MLATRCVRPVVLIGMYTKYYQLNKEMHINICCIVSSYFLLVSEISPKIRLSCLVILLNNFQLFLVTQLRSSLLTHKHVLLPASSGDIEGKYTFTMGKVYGSAHLHAKVSLGWFSLKKKKIVK